MTYQIIITEETAANIIIDNNTTNVSITTNEYPITIEYNAVIEQAGGNTTYGDSNVRTFLASGTNTGNIITTSNVSGAYILGNGSQLTGLPATYGNANVAANLAAFGSNPISTTGNITAGYFAGNGSLLTNITAGNITGTVANATYALNANAATYATNAVQAAVANVANSVAGANVSGTVANATYALNSNAATFATQATFATTANAVAGANVSGTVANATYALNANASTFAGTVTTAAQPNITSLGIQTAINTSGNISATGNITGNYFLGNGSQLTGLPATYGNANVAANLAAFGSNPISTSGNITAGYFLGNGSQLTGLPATYSNANVQAFLPTYSGNIGELTVNGNLTVTGTTSTVNTEIVNVSESVVGNVDAGNLRTAGQVTATGNITGGNIVSAGQGNIDNILTDAVQFDVTAAEATAVAKLNWSSAYGTVSHGLGDGSLLLNGMDLVIYATNGEANTLSRGEVVYISGAVGDRAEIKRAAATNDAVSATTIGIVKNDIASGAAGYVTSQGVVENLNLGAFTAGQVVWLSSTPGQFTATQPYAPTHTVFIGVVERANAGNGRLLVRVNNGWELGELHDVKITSPANNQYLKYSTGAGNIWVNAGLDISDDTTPALGGDLAGGAYNISGTGNVSAGNFIGSGQFLTSLTGANVSGTVATANTVTNAAQANITSVGTLTSLSVSGNVDAGNLRTAGVVTATGNVTGGNVIVPINGRYYGDFTSATASGRTAFQTTATGTTAATNITVLPGINHTTSNTAFNSSYNLFASTDVGNSALGSLRQFGNLTLLIATNTGTAAAGNMRLAAGSSQINLLTTGNVGIGNTAPQHNLSVNSNMYVGTDLSVNGNIQAVQNVITPSLLANAIYDNGAGNIAVITGNVQASGNITAVNNIGANTVTAISYFSTPALFTSELTAPGGGPLQTTTSLSTISGNLSVTGTITGSGNITGGNLLTGGLITATGNINGANLVATANLTSTQQTVVGTANIAGGTGNIIISGKNIATDMAFAPDGGNAINAALSRVTVGTGWLGNITHISNQNRLTVQDTFVRGNTGTAVQLFASEPIVSLTANVTNGSFRVQGVGSRVRIGGGPDGNTLIGTIGVGSIGSVAALQPNIDVGNISPYFLGNTVVNQAVLNGGFVLVAPGSTVNNAYGMIPGLSGGGGNIVNYIGFASQLQGTAGSVTGNVFGVYHGSNTTQSTTGIGVSNTARSAPGYYAFYNADDVAQIKLGSLRSYNEFEFAANTSGTVNIDKNNAQVQYISPTGNVTIGDFQNFVSVANDGTNNDLQTDTVTLIIQQGATPYTVTMPTGNASIKYAGGISTIGATANSVTMVSITAIKSLGNALGSTLYLASVSSEFS